MQCLARSSLAGRAVAAPSKPAVGRPAPIVRAAAPEVDVSSTNGATASVPATPKPAASTAANAVEFEELSEIIRMVQETDIVELELKSKRFNLSLRKKEALAPPPAQVYAPAPVGAAPVAAPVAAAAPAPAAPAPAAAPAPPAPAKIQGVEIASPMAGTFYRSPAPGEPMFAKEGDKVKKGQTVCIIEAMKLMNEIEAEIGGEIIKYLVENGSQVSPGQALMLIKP